MFAPSGLGLNSQTQTISADGTSTSRFQSVYNNGLTRLAFRVNSMVPTDDATVNQQAREFNTLAFNPILQNLANNGLIGLPLAYSYINPDGIPTMSQMTNWGGNGGGIDPFTGAPTFGASPAGGMMMPQAAAAPAGFPGAAAIPSIPGFPNLTPVAGSPNVFTAPPIFAGGGGGFPQFGPGFANYPVIGPTGTFGSPLVMTAPPMFMGAPPAQGLGFGFGGGQPNVMMAPPIFM